MPTPNYSADIARLKARGLSVANVPTTFVATGTESTTSQYPNYSAVSGAYYSDPVAEINAAREANMDAGISAYSGAGARGQLTQPITADSLKTTIPYQLPNLQSPTAQNPIFASTGQQVSDYLTEQEAAKGAAKTTAQSDLESSLKSYLDIPNQQIAMESTPEYIQAQTDKRKYGQQLLDSQRRQERELLALQSSGLTASQADAERRVINRRYAFEQSDISLNKSVADSNFADLQANIDRKIALMTEQGKTLYDYRSRVYDEIKDSLTKTEDRQFQALLDKTNRENQLLDTDAKNTYALVTNGLQNGMPANIFNQANSLITQGRFKEAQNLVAPYQVNQLDQSYKQAQIDKIYSDIRGTGSGVSVPAGVLAGDAYINAFNNAVIGLPAAAQKIATQTFQGYMNNNDTEGARAYLIRMATQGLPAADQTQALGRAQATATLKEVQSLLEQAKQKGKILGQTNIVTGTLNNVASKLGASTNPDLNYIGARIQQQLQVYRRSMTGVAFSPQESKEYAKIFPDITNLDNLNQAKIQALTDSFDSNNRAALSFLLGGENNYEQIFGAAGNPMLPSGQSNKTGTIGNSSIFGKPGDPLVLFP